MYIYIYMAAGRLFRALEVSCHHHAKIGHDAVYSQADNTLQKTAGISVTRGSATRSEKVPNQTKRAQPLCGNHRDTIRRRGEPS